MISFLRRLFAVRYAYPDTLQAMRARIVLPLSLLAAIILIVINVLTALNLIAQRNGQIHDYALIILPVAWGTALLTAFLVQRGRIGVGIVLLGALLVAYNLADVLISGSMTTGVIFPMVIVYFSLAFGVRGAAAAYVYAVLVLLGMYLIRSDGRWGTERIDNLSSIVFYSSANLAVTAIMLWLFAGNLQRTFRQSTRIVSQTRATAAIGQTLSRILNVDELLTQAADLIRDRFALYHVQIYLVDQTRHYADLAASTGEIGRALLAQGFRIPVGPRAAAGQVIGTGELCYITDISETAYYVPPLLANTRTELSLPLFAGSDVTGVLDIHSTRPTAFSNDDIETMRVLANQLSQAIQNARLFESQQQNLLQNRRLFLESETNLREIERLNRQLTGLAWQEYIVERDPAMFGVQLTGEEVNPGPVEWTPAMRQAAERRRIVSQQRGDEQTLAVPISIRGEAIGAIEVRLSGQQNQTEVRNIVQAVAERMAVNLENIRLFEQARIAAEREQQINRITARLQGLTSIDDVLSTALDTLGQALGAERGSIRLAAREVIPVEEPFAPIPDPAVQPLSDQRKTSEASVPPQNNDTGSQA